MPHGANGFRWFVCRAGSDHWKECPCGWRPDLGVHYAIPEHVAWTRKMRKRYKTQEAFDSYVAERAFPTIKLNPAEFERLKREMERKKERRRA